MKATLNDVFRLSAGFGKILAILALSVFACHVSAAQGKSPVVRLATLKIDSTQIESYSAALKEGIETALRVEPGVLTLYAVSEKNHPSNITVFEIYADTEAYQAHLETPHFKKYKETTRNMVKSLKLVEVVPIALGTKSGR